MEHVALPTWDLDRTHPRLVDQQLRSTPSSVAVMSIAENISCVLYAALAGYMHVQALTVAHRVAHSRGVKLWRQLVLSRELDAGA